MNGNQTTVGGKDFNSEKIANKIRINEIVNLYTFWLRLKVVALPTERQPFDKIRITSDGKCCVCKCISKHVKECYTNEYTNRIVYISFVNNNSI